MRTTLLAVGMLVALGGALATTASAARYYSCPSGYSFQTSSNAARCYKPATTQTASLLACPNVQTPAGSVGLFEAIDRLSTGRDQCAAQNPIAGAISVDRKCPAGYTYRIVRPGRDRCEKRVTADVRSPSIAVER